MRPVSAATTRLFLRQYRFRLLLLAVIITLTIVTITRREDNHGSDGRIAEITEQLKDDSSLYVDSRNADEIYRNVTVLCYILTMERNMDNRVVVVNATWAKRCNKVLYLLCTDRKGRDILSTCSVGESKEHLTGKVRYTLKYMYKHYLHKYDWFLKADDDTYVIMENLRYLLSHYPTNKAGYLGYHFKLFVNQGYMSGGAGYVINKQALKQLVEVGFSQNHCLEDGGNEDVEIGKCLQASNVSVFSSLDKFQRETFHTDTPWQHTLGLQPSYLDRYSTNHVHRGAECCSQFPVTYHHLDVDNIIFLEHMLYRTHVWGRHGRTDVKDLFPPKSVRPQNKHLLQSDDTP
ncbi:glycoprotein-N-acetylgalactosamine 3-beta-galactosyltransferase 1-like [Mizuhopecten yessoensis]|uniref:N-acetylgalactosaminide beta-1,3-galactosyltransferase n=1 Tax=Mizuhopecten yessoensis TaxID=6573 RepID=A0A210R470_MIZYE|nr:glycoprotein-N-acetylgalactosamine 3-beta-galactosyltransferase 1-like [Mizuhopecten yessoensis]XP_021361970.1 glycoprotein-N-acetylgalactosamine 3-beta-galactosyltransferase 1-like [Mizuhopecten yessoensis]XP_021361979.1 glycoprotein-N-acetylgalactosamine 3-beta-galactosyltransferase 1-like [Mizuhopecten yessoensis]OWF55768.1 Glycoprotein-N-acetylgalactosamine 3-beta-galactosyltransferase 1 [Mizuhopecten yessoensis]